MQRSQGVNLETTRAREEEEKARRIAAQQQTQDVTPEAPQQQNPEPEQSASGPVREESGQATTENQETKQTQSTVERINATSRDKLTEMVFDPHAYAEMPLEEVEAWAARLVDEREAIQQEKLALLKEVGTSIYSSEDLSLEMAEAIHSRDKASITLYNSSVSVNIASDRIKERGQEQHESKETTQTQATVERINTIRHLKEKEQDMGNAPQDEQKSGQGKKEKKDTARLNEVEPSSEHEPSTPKNAAKSLDAFEAPQPPKDANHKNVPYKDLGDKLEVSKTIPGAESGKQLAQVAKEQGWKTIEVDGAADFKQAAWREATAQGLEVKGYRPNEQDLKAVEERKAELAKDKPNSIQHMAHAKTFNELIKEMSPEQQKEAQEYFNKQFNERSRHKDPAQVAMAVPAQEQIKNAEQEKTTNQERDR